MKNWRSIVDAARFNPATHSFLVDSDVVDAVGILHATANDAIAAARRATRGNFYEHLRHALIEASVELTCRSIGIDVAVFKKLKTAPELSQGGAVQLHNKGINSSVCLRFPFCLLVSEFCFNL